MTHVFQLRLCYQLWWVYRATLRIEDEQSKMPLDYISPFKKQQSTNDDENYKLVSYQGSAC